MDTEHDDFERVEIYIYILINYVYLHTHSSLQNIAKLVYPNPPPLHAHQIGTNWAGMNIEVSAARPAVRTESAAELAGIRLANVLSCWGKNLHNLRKKSIPAILSSSQFCCWEK